jgi:hypothetical protein
MPSSVIHHFSYNAKNASLKITFQSGSVYVYKDVPKKVFRALTIAGSKGRYFNSFIKNVYLFEQLPDA